MEPEDHHLVRYHLAALTHSTKNRARNVFDALIQEARQKFLAKNSDKLLIFKAYRSMWEHTLSRPPRRWDSVMLPEKIKNGILNDCREFLAAKDFYAARGLPYRRGYMLYGVPGSGKSTTSGLAPLTLTDISCCRGFRAQA